MFRETGRAVKRGGEMVLGTVEIVAEAAVWALGVMLPPRGQVRQGGTMEAAPAVVGPTPTGSPLDNVGPVPEELLRDPFTGDSVPWSIQEAEKEEGRARELMIWKVAIAVSWAVTAVALLKSFGSL